MTFVGGPGAVALLAAIVANNIPEGIGGTTEMRAVGYSNAVIVAVWTGIGLVLFGAVVVGKVGFQNASPELISVIRSFAGGAVLATLADATMSDAYQKGGPAIAIATAAGFLTTFAISLI